MKMTLKANSRSSFKVPSTPIGDVFYTFEYGEERFYDDLANKDEYEKAKQLLWDAVNGEVAKQVNETLSQYQKGK